MDNKHNNKEEPTVVDSGALVVVLVGAGPAYCRARREREKEKGVLKGEVCTDKARIAHASLSSSRGLYCFLNSRLFFED